MKRTHVIILSLALFVFAPGCSVQDPDQPAVGSISINARSDAEDGKPAIKKKTLKSLGSPR